MGSQYTKKLTIGLPVYNGEKFVHNAIKTILQQSYENFELIISDNNSTDNSKKICESFAKNDNRIKYVYHNENKGYVWNFNYLLEHASTDYFMWAGADDVWHPKFVEKNLEFLERNKEFVGSISEVELFYNLWRDEDFNKFNNLTPTKKFQWVQPLVGSYEEKIESLFKFYRFEYAYSIFRTDILKKCMITKKFLSWEIPIILNLLKFGNLNVIDGVMSYKYMGGKDTYQYHQQLFTTSRKHGFGILNSLFPFFLLTYHVYRIVGTKIFLKHLLKRFILNNYRAQRLVFLDTFSRLFNTRK